MEKSSPKENLRQNHSSIIIKLWHTFVRSIANTVFGKLFAINFAIICKFVTQFFTLILFLCTEKLSHFTFLCKFIIVWAGKCTFLTLGDCIQDTRNTGILNISLYTYTVGTVWEWFLKKLRTLMRSNLKFSMSSDKKIQKENFFISNFIINYLKVPLTIFHIANKICRPTVIISFSFEEKKEEKSN